VHAADPVFVGRSSELARLRGALEDSRSGHARVVAVEGGPGVGKSALLRRFLTAASIPTVLRASGESAEMDLQWGVIRQLGSLATPRPSGQRAARPTGWPDPVPGTDPLAVGARVLAALGALQRRGVVAVVVDDAHWADQVSARALQFAARRLAFDRVIVVLVLRPDQADHLGEGWRRVLDDDRAVRIRLAGLSIDEVADLSRAYQVPLSQPAARRLREHTSGSPLHTIALLRELDLDVLRGDAGSLPAPRAVTEVVQAGLRRCRPATVALVTAAAVLGERASLAAAAAVADLTEATGPLDEAQDAQLLLKGPGDGEVSFPHGLVRAATYTSIGTARRAELHARAASVLTGPAAITHRVAAADGPDDALANDLTVLADKEAGSHDLSAAGVHRLQAARVTPPGAARDARLLHGLEELLSCGEIGHAEPAAAELATVPASARRSYLAGHLALWAGRPAESQTLMRDAWNQLEHDRLAPADRFLSAAIAFQLALLSMILLRLDDAALWATRARDAAGARSELGLAAAVPRAAAGHAGESLADLVTLGPAQLVPHGMINALVGRGLVRMWTDDLDSARSDLSCALDRARAGESLQFAGQAAGFLSETCYRAGRLDQAVVHSELACDMAESSGRGWDRAFVHALAVLPLAALGHMTDARAHLDTAFAAANSLDTPAAFAYAASAAAALVAADGTAASGEDLLHAAARHRHYIEPGAFPGGPIAADALLSLGRLDEADAALTEFEIQAGRFSRASALASAARVRGRLEASRGRPDDAAAAFEAGLRHADGLGQPLEEARIRLTYGDALLSAGNATAARSQYGVAADILEPIRAAPYLNRALAGLAQAGGRSRRAGRATPVHHPHDSTLSPQEASVAALVADGLTNREIAAELVLSVKTVEYHLTKIYARLGVRSRAALAALLAANRR
jgi:DNA-binding CsgD family transcriptional regulator